MSFPAQILRTGLNWTLAGWAAVRQSPGLLIAVLAIALPWLSWIHLTSAFHSVAALHTPHWLWAMGSIGLMALLVAQHDAWLGLLVGYTAIRAISAEYVGTFEVVYVVGLGGLGLWAIQRIPKVHHHWIVTAMVAGGVLEVIYLIQQAFGYDLLWGHWYYHPGSLFGTMGNGSYIGVYLGMLIPLAPWWLLPVFATGLSLTQSGTGMVVGIVGLLIRYRAAWWMWCSLMSAFAGWLIWHGSETLIVRWRVWKDALAHWLDISSYRDALTTGALTGNPAPFFGYGLGGWYDHYCHPVLQGCSAPMIKDAVGERFIQAHNEWLQWGYDAGLVGLFCVCGWCYRHRRAFLSPVYGGAMTAIALTACTMFTFRLTIPGITGLVILGLGTASEEGDSS